MGIPSLFRPGLFCWNLINQSLKELNRNHQCGVFLVMTSWVSSWVRLRSVNQCHLSVFTAL